MEEQINDEIKTYSSFDDMKLNKDILQGIYSMGFEEPSPIQRRAIVPLMGTRDLIAQAQSGTGKTATFSIAILQKINESLDEVQALILAPTRELAKQIYNVISGISKYTNIKINLIIGGTNRLNYNRFGKSEEDEEKFHIVVGTPGRVVDLLGKNIINPEFIKYCVLDEADEILSKGFQNQLCNIFGIIPRDAQIALFSATIPNNTLDITNQFMSNPLKILIASESLTLDGIKQFYVSLRKEDEKYDVLCDLYGTIQITQCMIYCNSKRKVEWLGNDLRNENYTVSTIHGDMTQDERNTVMNNFRKGATRILITTDILSRGIDVQQVSLVINYDLPIEKETYIHRIGRSGRYGRKGVAVNLITGYDIEKMDRIKTFYGTEINELPNNIGELI